MLSDANLSMRQDEKLCQEIADLRAAYATTWNGAPTKLEAMADDELVRQVLVDTTASAQVVAHAIWLAPRVVTRDIVYALLELIRNPDVAGLAADSLIEIKDSDTAEKLEQLLLEEALPIASRAAAAEALGWLSRVGREHAVISLLRTMPVDPIFVQALIDAAGLLQLRENRRDCAVDIADFLRSPSPDVRATALRVLGNMGAREVVARISAMVGDHERTSTGATVSERAQIALERLRNTRS